MTYQLPFREQGPQTINSRLHEYANVDSAVRVGQNAGHARPKPAVPLAEVIELHPADDDGPDEPDFPDAA